MVAKPFGDFARIYRNHGLHPRPLKYPGVDKDGNPYGKLCLERGWQHPDDQQVAGTLARWDQHYPYYNIGLLMGTELPDGTRLGALDVDHDAYIPLAKALFGGIIRCGRIGKKGIVVFFRYRKRPRITKYKVKGEFAAQYGQVAELLLERALCVIPPSIHPATGEAYRWVGTPLHEMNLLELPLIGEQ